MRLAFVIPWRDLGRWVWETLPEEEHSGDLIFAAPEPGTFFDRRRWLPPYIAEFVHLARRRPQLDRYDVIFTWELRSALAVSVLRRLRPANRQPRFVPVGPILKGPVLRVLPWIRLLLRDADRIVCFSPAECDSQSRLLRLPRDRFVFVPTPWPDDETVSEADDGYVLALGHSGRDYPTLLRAVQGTELPVLIVTRGPADLGNATIPSNVKVRYNTGHHETNALIAKATLHVIPLKNANHSAGQTVLLRGMACGKPVIVSDTPGVRDYVRPGETAVLVPSEDVTSLRDALCRLWADVGERQRIGRAAALSVREEFGFPKFARRLATVAHELG